MLDERQIRSLHVEALTREEMAAEGHEPHVLHQTSTIQALLDGAYDGDLTLGELRETGNLGLGTTNGLDGELIVLEGCCYRASIDGSIERLDDDVMTPFAVVAEFEPTAEKALVGPMDFDQMTSELDALRPSGMPSCAVRVDGSFARLRARSVPRQEPQAGGYGRCRRRARAGGPSSPGSRTPGRPGARSSSARTPGG